MDFVFTMDVFFIDDAAQLRPSRPGMGPLIAIGGIRVPEVNLQILDKSLNALCQTCGFPNGDMFKWSPGKELWMKANLVEEARFDFYTKAIQLAIDNGATATVIIFDKKYHDTTGGNNHEHDALKLFIERAQKQLAYSDCLGLIIAAQPSSSREEEYKFLGNSLETLRAGTEYVKPENIALGMLSYPSRFSRLLQLADVVVSCSTAYVGGENTHSPRVFNCIKPMFVAETNRIGGIGLKIHPDIKYFNLYYWLLGDTHFWKNSAGFPLPLKGYQYELDSYIP